MGPWNSEQCIPAVTKIIDWQSGKDKLWCTNANCLKYSKAMIDMNPDMKPQAAPCFNHVIFACPYQISHDTGLTKQTGITSVDHAARIVLRKHKPVLAKVAFGSKCRYNKDEGKMRDKDLNSELRAAQRQGGCFK